MAPKASDPTVGGIGPYPVLRLGNTFHMLEGWVGNTPVVSEAREATSQPCLHKMYVAMCPDIFRLWRAGSMVGIATVHATLMNAAKRPISNVFGSTREARKTCGILRMAYTVEVWKQMGEKYADPSTSDEDRMLMYLAPGCGGCGLPTNSFCERCSGAVCTVCENRNDTCGCTDVYVVAA